MEERYHAGAGKAEIHLPDALFPTGEGFTAVHDPLYARAFLLEGNKSLLFIVLDLTSLPTEEAVRIQEQAVRELGRPVDRVWVSVSHTFSAPHLCPPQFIRSEEERASNALLSGALDAAVREAVLSAARTRPVKLLLERQRCDVNVNRDQELPEGWWLGADESGAADKTLTVLRAEDRCGQVVGALAHYAVQSSIMDGSTAAAGGKLVSGDLAGKAVSVAEAALESPVLFLVGAAGNQAPKRQALTPEGDQHEAGFRFVEELGGMLGEAIIAAARRPGIEIAGPVDAVRFTVACEGQVMPDRMKLRPTWAYTYEPDKAVETPVELLSVGEVTLVGIQPELDCEIAMQLQARTEDRAVLTVTMVNGGAKYMASEESYERFTYEARNSMFARGSAERLRDAVLKAIHA